MNLYYIMYQAILQPIQHFLLQNQEDLKIYSNLQELFH
nr:MAG TPA: hypothetical protein [Bacteriophage sp.]